MRKFYILDLRGCTKKPKWFDDVDEIYLVDGDHCCEFDVLEDALPPDLCNFARYESWQGRQLIKRLAKEGDEALNAADFMPLGLNRAGFPEGAILRELKK